MKTIFNDTSTFLNYSLMLVAASWMAVGFSNDRPKNHFIAIPEVPAKNNYKKTDVSFHLSGITKIITKGQYLMRISKVLESESGVLTVVDDGGNTVKRDGGTAAWRNNNPGNVKDGTFARELGSIGRDYIGHAVFPTVEHGEQAQYVLLFKDDGKYYNLTLADAIARYAPKGDSFNNPKQYAKYISDRTDIPVDMKLKKIPLDKRIAMINIMQRFEGYKKGKDVLKKDAAKRRKITRPSNNG